MGRGMKGQMKDADRSGARYAVIFGDDELAAGEATVKDLEHGRAGACRARPTGGETGSDDADPPVWRAPDGARRLDG